MNTAPQTKYVGSKKKTTKKKKTSSGTGKRKMSTVLNTGSGY